MQSLKLYHTFCMVYSQLSLRRTSSGLALAVHLSSRGVQLIESRCNMTPGILININNAEPVHSEYASV